MVRGLYTAAAGALVAQSQADAIANNLANVNTSGFKRTLLQVESAPEIGIYRFQTDPGSAPNKGVAVSPYVGALGTGSQIYDTPTVFSQGPLQQTGNPLDFAIEGNGFFTIQTPQGVRYTRNGQFVRNAQGLLSTTNGDLVLGTNRGPISVPNGPFQVAADGTIAQNGQALGQLQLTQFGNLVALRPEGDSRFVDTGAARPSTATGASVQQGYLEGSNANVIRSMVDLISAQRWFEANEKVIYTQDATTGLSITGVGQAK